MGGVGEVEFAAVAAAAAAGGWCEGGTGTGTGTDCRDLLCVYKGSLVMFV